MSESAHNYVLNVALPEDGPSMETAKPCKFSDQ